MKCILGAAAALILLASPAKLEVGQPVPDVKIGGRSLSELSGKVVCVYFWSQDCPFGPPMFDTVNALSSKYAHNEKVAFISVASFGEAEAKVSAWAKDSGFKTPLVHDGDRAVARHFGAGKVNATYVIDAKGVLVYRGGLEPAGEAIEAALAGKPAPKSDAPFKGCRIKI